MIPTMILVGLFVGLLPRPWYLLGVVLAACGWAVLLVQTGVVAASDYTILLGGFVLALLNVLVGVGLTRVTAQFIRRLVSQP